MADNVAFTVTGATYTAATDKVTYSGDANVDVQLVRLVGVTGAEGSKTVTEVMGTAGSPGTAVLTIQGVASGTAVPVSIASVPSHAVTNAGTFVVQENGAALTALQLIDNLVLAEDAAHNTGDPGVQALAVRNDSDASLAGTTGDYTPLQVDSNGYLKVNIKAGSAANAAASATGSAVPSSADYSGVNVGGTLRGATALGVGSHYAQTVAIVDASGNQITSFGGSAGVVSATHVVAAASANATSIKASAGTLRGFSFFNNAAYPVYLKFHNTAGTPTAGSGVVRTFAIQAGMQRDVVLPGGGISFATGIGITLVQDLADSGTTAVAANDAVGEIFYE